MLYYLITLHHEIDYIYSDEFKGVIGKPFAFYFDTKGIKWDDTDATVGID